MKPYLIISFGMLIYAFAATGFLVPHKIVGGGATGIATVASCKQALNLK
jgi:uncharacterized membrane-anchored protein YitT (DUF2179 family)